MSGKRKTAEAISTSVPSHVSPQLETAWLVITKMGAL